MHIVFSLPHFRFEIEARPSLGFAFARLGRREVFYGSGEGFVFSRAE
jgi:hypothetical protein